MHKKFLRLLLSGICITALLAGCGNNSQTSDTEKDTVTEQNDTSEDTEKEEVQLIKYEVPDISNAVQIQLSDEQITLDGEVVGADASAAVYTANDIVFYLEGQDFTYGEGSEGDAHSQAEADSHTVVHITEPGTYAVSGTLSAGQIAIDLGEDAKDDPNAVVNLVMDGADITCSVAPAVIFYNVYECGDTDTETAAKDVDTTAAGANVIIADNTTNNIDGAYVARIYESYVLNDEGTEVTESESLHKYDGAFYSQMSMNVFGESDDSGILNIKASNEGLDTELHLGIHGGTINIQSGNDGINTNEDYVSVTTITGGNLNIYVDGSTGEGDGIDSNGWLVIHGGSVTASACGISGDAGIDSDMGIYINGGTVKAAGNMLDRISGGSQTYAVFSFASTVSGGSTITLKDDSNAAVMTANPENDFTYLILAGDDLKEGTYTLWNGDTQLSGAATGNMMGGPGMGGGQMPEDMEIPEGMEMPQMPENGEMPEGMERPDGMEMPQNGEIPEGMEMPQDGERPEMPQNGEMPEDMERPDGMEMPQNGERPEMPENGEMPEGMELPEGAQMPEGGQNPGRGQMNGNISVDSNTLTTEFALVAGGNMFSCVTAAS